MKLLYDFLPIVLFFAAYKVSGIFVATAVAIVTALAQVTVSWARHRRVEPLHLVSAGLIAVLGGATLILHDKSFIMWKPTLVYVLFAGVFVTTQLFGKRPLIQRLLGSQMQLPASVWRRLGWAWVAFFLVCGAANAGFVQYYGRAEQALELAAPAAQERTIDDLDCAGDFSGHAAELCRVAAARESLWVNFKLFGLIALTLLFVIGQALWLTRHAEGTEPDGDGDATGKGDGPRCSTQS